MSSLIPLLLRLNPVPDSANVTAAISGGHDS